MPGCLFESFCLSVLLSVPLPSPLIYQSVNQSVPPPSLSLSLSLSAHLSKYLCSNKAVSLSISLLVWPSSLYLSILKYVSLYAFNVLCTNVYQWYVGYVHLSIVLLPFPSICPPISTFVFLAIFPSTSDIVDSIGYFPCLLNPFRPILAILMNL